MEKESKEQKVWITVSETINIGNYNSIKIDAGYSKSYNKESPTTLIESGVDELLKIIQKKSKKIRKNSKT